MTRLSIRQTTPEDYGSVTRILQHAYTNLLVSAYEPDLLSAALQSMARANPALLASGAYFIAEWEGRTPVACGGWSRQRPGTNSVEDGVGHLRHFATHGDWAGHGIGGEVYAECEAQAAAAGVGVFECYATLNAERFYQSVGFETVGPFTVRLGKSVDFPCVKMRREIP
ncbi:MAG: GNAT family N-acetyltransferase [Pseudomonadota bacterium]